jgi:hypothetical protein
MKAILFSFILLFAVFTSYTQNLVNNPSFETFTACPSAYGQINNATGWANYLGSVDYMHTCATFASVGVPNSFFGNEPARTGNAYGGLLTYHSSAPREITGRALITPLVVGTTYYCSLWASVGENYSRFATNNLGFQFNTSATGTVSNVSQVYSAGLLTNNSGWVQVTGSFVAGTAFTHVAVGNFFTDANTTISVLNAGVTFQAAYYFIEDICVSPTPGDCFTALPIVWNEMNARADTYNQNVGVRWSLENQENFKEFYIERQDGHTGGFKKIKIIQTANNQSYYEYFDDLSSEYPVFFYAVRAIDKNGASHLSRIIEVQNPNYDYRKIQVYPNPVQKNEMITVDLPVINEKAYIALFDVSGKLISEDFVKEGINHVQIKVPSESGVYVLKINRRKAFIQRIIVQ